jgi:hypothetical protein
MTLPSGSLVKWSSFGSGGNAVAGDQLVGLRQVNGQEVNMRFSFNSAVEFQLARQINQVAHGFTTGTILRLSGSTYVAAQADSSSDANVVGAVIGVPDVDDFVLWFGGWDNTLSGLTPGANYFLSATSPGGYTATAPSTPGQVRVPLFVADSATSAYWIYGGGVQQL